MTLATKADLIKRELGIEEANLAAVADRAVAELGIDATGMAIAQKLDAAVAVLGLSGGGGGPSRV